MISIFRGDFSDLIKNISDKSIDLVVTDPPFLHVKGGMKSKKLNVGKMRADSYINTKMNDFGEQQIFDFLNAVNKKMVKTNMYIFCSKLQLQYYFKWIYENKKKYDLLVWNKQKTAMKSTKFFTSDIDYVVRIYENGVSLNKIIKDNGVADSTYYTKIQSYSQPKGVHETIKPIELVKKYILLSSNAKEMVLDPFMGSGTTGVACKSLGRSFIGFEIDENYFNIAKERIENEG